MADEVWVYISAGPDLQREREILGRAVTEVPVPLGWRVVQSPSGDAPADLTRRRIDLSVPSPYPSHLARRGPAKA